MPVNNRFGYPFSLVVTPEAIARALKSHGVCFRNRVLDPATTIWAWMSQIASEDRSCRHVVSRLAAYHAADGRAVSVRTGAYTQARQKLDLAVIQHLCRTLARTLEAEYAAHSPLGRPVLAVDGTTISGPDTEDIQREYPQHAAMLPGVGFPIIRALFVVSITTGAVMDLGMAAISGTGNSELSMFRHTWPHLLPGDLVLGDRLFHTYWYDYRLRHMGVDTLCRKLDKVLLRGRPVLAIRGKNDRVYRIAKPNRPRWMTRHEYVRAPASLPLRVAVIPIGTEGRPKRLELASSLIEPGISTQTLADLYRLRWHVELDIRAIKLDLGADILSCKTPEMLRKELWMTALTYNAVRAMMARAAVSVNTAPRNLSFKGALQAINAFSPRLDRTSDGERDAVVQQMLAAIASHRVGNRPDRVEPRVVKRRRKPILLMTVPRDEARRLCRGGRYE